MEDMYLTTEGSGVGRTARSYAVLERVQLWIGWTVSGD